jgi:hypothetical protein
VTQHRSEGAQRHLTRFVHQNCRRVAQVVETDGRKRRGLRYLKFITKPVAGSQTRVQPSTRP